ncbi:hypothetical protein DPMN_117983 [Dreissena polymorpha]|uniref:Uncharacterized protein n=2 Tax=Dreissena polymorpha TaxID=45954 RepID=A0A9D4GMA7_DREPO|nr:hypothetical protein DPMN_117983 [Dreissena polymorpha]
MPLKGYYELMSLDALGISLHGRFGVCESSNALHSCLIGFVVEHNGTEYYISHDGYDQVSSVQIMTAGEPLMLYGELQLGNITLELESKTTIKMKVEGSDMVIKLSSISERLMATVSLPRAEFDAYQPTLDGIVTSCDTAVAVTASNCSSVTRQAICDKTHSVASECELPQTKDSLAAYVSKKMYTNQAFMDIVEKKYLSPLAPNCLEYSNGNGMTAAGITLPSSDFALEMHVKPKTNGGVLMTYDKEGEYLVLLNHDVTNQLVLHTATKNFFTGLKLAQNKWNQISLAWRDDAGVMELYLADDNGISTVYAAEVPDLFDSKGTLTLGQVTPGLTASIAAGDFNGHIDEVRIWSRPHNPNVITDNFRVTVTDMTEDVSHNWNFNEGMGLSAYEKSSGQNFVPVNVENAPKWVKSDLDLAVDDDLDAPQMTKQDAENAAALANAQAQCANLISEFSLNAIASDMNTLLAVYEALCVQELMNSNDTDSAAAIMVGMADLYGGLTNDTNSPIQGLCNVLDSLSLFLGVSGSNCTSCNFGSLDESGTCMCLDSHWGASCDDICPVGKLGACNARGVCDIQSGKCNCHPRHYTGGNTVEDFWKKFVSKKSMGMKDDYTCASCSGDWVGKECEFSKITPKSTTEFTGMVYGSYLTTFDGMSLLHAAPGTYSLFKASDVEVQALFEPCKGNHACRLMSELAIASGTTLVHIQHNPVGNMSVVVKHNGKTEKIEYPHNVKSYGKIDVAWSEGPFVKVQQESIKIITYDSPIGLITHGRFPSSQAGANNGMFGNSANSWLKTIKCPDDTTTLKEDEVTSQYAGNCIRENYTPSKSIIDHELGSEDITSAGFSMTVQSGGEISIGGFDLQQELADFTVGFWVKVETLSKKRSIPSLTIMTLDVGSYLAFKVDSGELVVDWNGEYRTDILVSTDKWYYLAFTWATDGKASVYLITETQVQVKDPLPDLINTGLKVNLTGINITASSTETVTVDCVRTWKIKKSLTNADADSRTYCGPTSPTDTALLLAIPFDEGEGNETTMTIYNEVVGTTAGHILDNVAINLTEPVVWKPSNAPVSSISSPGPLTVYHRSNTHDYTQAAINCLSVLDNENITKHCEVLPSGIRDHLLEACIREHDRAGKEESKNIMYSSLIFYCATAMKVDECKFKGYFYFCDETAEDSSGGFPMWIIGVAAGILLLLILLIIIVIRLKKKKKENQEFTEQQDEINQQYQMLHSKNTNTRFNKSRLAYYDNRETSFVNSGASGAGRVSAWSNGRDSAMSDGRASQNTISSRFFESPMMFMSDEPSGPNRARSQTPTSSRGFSPLSFLGKGTVSPTPTSIMVDTPGNVPDTYKSKKDFTGVKTEGKGTFSAVSKLLDKARKEAPAESPHPAPLQASAGPNTYPKGPMFKKRESAVSLASINMAKRNSASSMANNSFGTTSPPMSPTDTQGDFISFSPTGPSGDSSGGRNANLKGPVFRHRDSSASLSSLAGSSSIALANDTVGTTSPLLSPIDEHGNFLGTSSQFGGVLSPRPSFGADAPTSLTGKRGTPNAAFLGDGNSSSALDGEAAAPWKKLAPIPRLPPPLSRKKSNVDDLDMI